MRVYVCVCLSHCNLQTYRLIIAIDIYATSIIKVTDVNTLQNRKQSLHFVSLHHTLPL